MFAILNNFLKEVRQEVQRVVWPDRDQITRLTLIVLVISGLVGFYVSLLDYGFSNLIGVLIGGNL